jgi:hypothetical protein
LLLAHLRADEEGGEGEGGDTDNEETVHGELACDKDGFPVLPARGDCSLEDCKRVIREYVTLHYRMFFVQYDFRLTTHGLNRNVLQ